MPATPPSPVITVNGLGKAYRSYARPRDRLVEWLSFDTVVRHSLHWALQEVDLQVRPGESVAVIGENGAGKSTLLKLISGVIRPTTGRVSVNGRVTALLELGLGFHGDFSGLDNLPLSGQLQGLTRQEVQSLTEWILDFADIGEAIHEPVRTYSSGMQMRLAFALAVAKRPDVLIVDEALSVGDIFFQQKCFELLASYVEQGSALLFVTHGMATAYHLCERALYLHGGRVVFDGAVKEAIDRYESSHLLAKKTAQANGASMDADSGSLVSQAMVLEKLVWLDSQGHEVHSIDSGESITLRVLFRATVRLDGPHPGFKLRNRRGLVVYETNTYCQHLTARVCEPGDLVQADFSFRCDVVEGEYNITLGVATGGYGEGSFQTQIWYAHGLAPLVVRRVADAPLWDGVVNLRPTIDFNLAKPSASHRERGLSDPLA